MVKVEWHDQDYLYLKWHVVCRGLATPLLDTKNRRIKSSNDMKKTALMKDSSIKITILNLNTMMMKMNEKFLGLLKN